MGFKDILSADRAIFMNPEEFGEVHNVGGRSMTILIDDNEMHTARECITARCCFM